MRAALLVAAIVASGCVPALPLAPYVGGALVVALWFGVRRTWRQCPALSGERITLLCVGDGNWRCQDRHGARDYRLHGESYATPWLVVLLLVAPLGGRRTLVLPRDALAAGDFRRLRVALARERRVLTGDA